jgi:hypothetical protein
MAAKILKIDYWRICALRHEVGEIDPWSLLVSLKTIFQFCFKENENFIQISDGRSFMKSFLFKVTKTLFGMKKNVIFFEPIFRTQQGSIL